MHEYGNMLLVREATLLLLRYRCRSATCGRSQQVALPVAERPL
eukprot:COSAG06_NODE_20144_length_806_cov_2.933522_3_plen_42_part_01